MEFASYLTYRGVPVEGVEGKIPPGEKTVLLAATAIAEDGRCVGWTRIRCHAVTAPVSGDLVIVLPDDKASLAEVSVYRKAGEEEQLLSYEARPQISGLVTIGFQWASSLYNQIYAQNQSRSLDGWIDNEVELIRSAAQFIDNALSFRSPEPRQQSVTVYVVSGVFRA